MRNFSLKISEKLGIPVRQIGATQKLLEEGATIPFISRYRKEVTGSLDEVQVTQIRDLLTKLKELDQRRAAILKTIEEQGKLSTELQAKIDGADTLSVLEDLYLPYKPKRKTKATIAKEKGLEPLADIIWRQGSDDVAASAQAFISDKKQVKTAEEALQGARDILAERINEEAKVRKKLRRIFSLESMIYSKVIKSKEAEAVKYKDYFEWSESLKNIPSHRLLAIRRGEKEMMLRIDIAPEETAS
ncbi:MAG: Tex-like N-terminal domain-containing protein, partial [Cyclobacteriaceae bacterium]